MLRAGIYAAITLGLINSCRRPCYRISKCRNSAYPYFSNFY